MNFRDLSTMARHERQAIYADILREKRLTMTPSIVKDELEKRGMTFAFVGQDMAAMRLMPFIQIEARGQYRWKDSFEGEVTLTVRRRSCVKRFRADMELERQDGPRVTDEGRDCALDALLAIAERESEPQCESWVMGYRISE